MGDHRARIEINFNFHDKDYKMDAWINYNGYNGVDNEVIKFFENAWQDGMQRFEEAQIKCELEKTEQELESKERAELARLKSKYE